MKIKLFMIIVAVCSLAVIGAFAQGTQAKLPDNANAYIQKHFPNERIVSVMRDDDTMEFDVILSGGTEIEFSRHGEMREVEGNMKAIPDSVVPDDIRTYVDNQHRGQDIRKIEKEPYGYEVTLSNGMDLKFDKTGKFLRIDSSMPSIPTQ